MNEADALEIVHRAMLTIVGASGPLVAVAMGVGLAVALMQALTQIQETTLTFVPKIIAIFFTLSFSLSFIASQIYTLTQQLYGRIQAGY